MECFEEHRGTHRGVGRAMEELKDLLPGKWPFRGEETNAMVLLWLSATLVGMSSDASWEVSVVRGEQTRAAMCGPPEDLGLVSDLCILLPRGH